VKRKTKKGRGAVEISRFKWIQGTCYVCRSPLCNSLFLLRSYRKHM